LALAALDVLKAIKIKHSIMTAKSFFIIQRISFKYKEMNFKFLGKAQNTHIWLLKRLIFWLLFF
jgi:hypothetical protein